MNHAEIEAFVAIVTTGSINEAAKRLHVSQPALSYRLKSLESKLGTKLFVRTRGVRTAELTPAGHRFLHLAERWHRLWEEAQRCRTELDRFDLRIASVDSLNSYVLPDFFRALAEQNPPFNVVIRTYQSLDIYNLVAKRDIDVGFAVQKMRTEDTSAIPLFEERMCIVRNAAYCSHHKPVHPHDLAPQKEIYIPWGHEYVMWREHWFGRTSSRLLNVDTLSLVFQFILTGDYWALVPESVARTYGDDGSIRFYDIEDGPPPRRCCIVVNKQPFSNAKTWKPVLKHALVKFLQQKPWLRPVRKHLEF